MTMLRRSFGAFELAPWMIDRIWRTRWKLLRVRFERFHHLRNCAFQLRVAICNDGSGIVFHDDVWIDAMPFDDILPIRRSRCEFRYKGGAAIKQRLRRMESMSSK